MIEQDERSHEEYDSFSTNIYLPSEQSYAFHATSHFILDVPEKVVNYIRADLSFTVYCSRRARILGGTGKLRNYGRSNYISLLLTG